MKHYYDVCLGPKGLPIPNVSVTVWIAGTGQTQLATIYSDDGITTKANPTTSDALGNVDFYAADGRYDLQFSGPGITSRLETDIEISDITQAATSDSSAVFKNLNNIRFADQFAGADFGLKVAAAIADLPSAGGVVDCRGFSGAQSLSANVTVNSGVTLILGPMALAMGNFGFVGAAGATDCAIIGHGYGGDQTTGTKGPILTYTGTGTAIQFGDTTTASYGIRIGGFKLDISGAGNAAIGVKLLPTVGFRINHLTIAAKTTTVASGNAQEAIQFNGGTGAVGAAGTFTGRLSEIYITGGKYGIRATSTDNTTTRVNNIQVDASVSIRTNVTGGDTRHGLFIENGDSWLLNGPDIESADVSLHLGAHAQNNYGCIRSEGSVTSDILADSGSTENTVALLVEDVTNAKITDNASAANCFRAMLDFRFNGVFASTGWQPGALDCWAWADSTTRWSIRKGHTADQEFDIDFRNGSTAAVEWSWGSGSAGTTYIRTGGGNNVLLGDATNLFLNPPAAGGATFLSFSQGTNGVNFGNGAGATVANIDSTGKFATYRNVAAAGNGAASIHGATSQKAESAADASVLSFTPPAAAGSYRITFNLSLSAASAAVLGWTATWKDANGNAKSPTNLSLFQVGTAAPALTFTTSTATDEFYGSATIDIDNSATAIVVKLTLGSGTFTGKASATVERLI